MLITGTELRPFFLQCQPLGRHSHTAQKYLIINWQGDDLMVISGSDFQGVHGGLRGTRSYLRSLSDSVHHLWKDVAYVGIILHCLAWFPFAAPSRFSILYFWGFYILLHLKP